MFTDMNWRDRLLVGWIAMLLVWMAFGLSLGPDTGPLFVEPMTAG